MAEELIAGITFLAGSCALYAHRRFKDYKARQRQQAKDLEQHLIEFERKRGITGNDTATYAKVLTEIYGCAAEPQDSAKRQRVRSPSPHRRSPSPKRSTPRSSPGRTASSSTVTPARSRRFRAKRTPRNIAARLYAASQPKWHVSPLVAPSAANSPRTSPKEGFF